MAITLCSTSSLEWWLHASCCDRQTIRVPTSELISCSPTIKDVAWLSSMAPWLSEPYHLLVNHKTATRNSSRCICHVLSYSIPEESLCRIANQAYAASPELTAIQVSRQASLIESVRLLSLLCAQFSFSKDNGSLPKRTPITSKSLLEAFAWANSRIQGSKLLKQALPYVVENAASPPEIDLAMRLALPHRYGGYGLVRPILNKQIPLSDGTQAVARRRYVVGDLCWPQAKLIIEYDSDTEHLNSTQAERDATKRLALSAEGYEVITVTSLMMKRPDTLEGIAQKAAKRLGLRIRIRDKNFAAKQKELFALARTIPWHSKTHKHHD